MNFFYSFGEYISLLEKTFSKPEQRRIYVNRIFNEATSIGVESLGIVTIISLFVGAVTTINTAYQLTSALIEDSVVGSVVSDSTILELAPTITSLVLAGKIGSNIATELGSMRVSEQIDAMEVMGVNSAGYLVFPKIIAALFMLPCLIIIAMFLSIMGGMMVGALTGIVSVEDFSEGARESFRTYTLFFAVVKSITFAFIISSVSSYQGFFVSGGSIEVGKASTRAVVYSSVLILLSDYMLAQLFL
ncbi:MAG: ABC transporter permease [Bacteroidota bacterium]|nr:ABC transporter permease [Bacteroidota bacterium]